MAVLRPEVDFNFKGIYQLVSAFPDLRGRLLALIGKRARVRLYEGYLSGQELTLRKYPVDARGRRTITSDVNRARTQVKIYSYPVNLFERGRKLRSGRKEQGKYIITRKLKGDVSGRMQSYINEWESRILEQELRKEGLN